MFACQRQRLPVNWPRNQRHLEPDYYISSDVDIVSPGPDTVFDYRHWTVVAYPSMIDFGAVMIDPTN